MIRKENIVSNIDWMTVVLFVLLVVFGWLNIYSAVYNEQHSGILDTSQRYGRQAMWIIAAMVMAFLIFLIDGKFLAFFAYPMYAFLLLLLIAVLVFGREIHGSTSWFELGSFQFQPSEFAKIGTSLVLAKYLSSYNVRVSSFPSAVITALFILLPAALIVIQPDMGSALVFVSFLLVIYRAGFSPWILLIGILMAAFFLMALLLDKLIILAIILGIAFITFSLVSRKFSQVLAVLAILAIPAGAIWLLSRYSGLDISLYATILLALGFSALVYLYLAFRHRLQKALWVLLFTAGSIGLTFSVDHMFANMLSEHQQNRVNILLGIESDPMGIGYNVNQSKIAIGSGGFWGKGYLQGTQTKFDFVPEQSTDFIFCTVGEEWGFAGTFLVISLFVILFLRLIRIAERQRSDFSRLYGYGVISVLFFHFAVNIGMTIGIFPVIGIPLPFFSYGGSSLWAFTILLFILLRLDASRRALFM